MPLMFTQAFAFSGFPTFRADRNNRTLADKQRSNSYERLIEQSQLVGGWPFKSIRPALQILSRHRRIFHYALSHSAEQLLHRASRKRSSTAAPSFRAPSRRTSRSERPQVPHSIITLVPSRKELLRHRPLKRFDFCARPLIPQVDPKRIHLLIGAEAESWKTRLQCPGKHGLPGAWQATDNYQP